MKKINSCWIVTEAGLTGTLNQCLGVTDHLHVTPVIKQIGLRQPWKSLSPWLGLESACTFTGDELAPPWPDLVIAAGRKAVSAARYIKKKSGGKTFTVFLQDPRIHPHAFDLVAVPAHDDLRGDNVIVTPATPNRITQQALTRARQEFSALKNITAPRVAVLIGGSSRTHELTPAVTQDLANQLKKLSDDGYGLMITASRRTDDACRKILRDSMAGTEAYLWDGTGANPYTGFLAWADYIIATGDSASMLSDAASTGKPVYMVPLPGGSPRFDRLYDALQQRGILRVFEGTLVPYAYTALSDAAMVAEEIKKRMG